MDSRNVCALTLDDLRRSLKFTIAQAPGVRYDHHVADEMIRTEWTAASNIDYGVDDDAAMVPVGDPVETIVFKCPARTQLETYIQSMHNVVDTPGLDNCEGLVDAARALFAQACIKHTIRQYEDDTLILIVNNIAPMQGKYCALIASWVKKEFGMDVYVSEDNPDVYMFSYPKNPKALGDWLDDYLQKLPQMRPRTVKSAAKQG